ncbi:MAG: type II secretion system protein [Ghiorsea sp.]|nr:type II secretion system protein [Ghiorsea sp.]
MSMDVEQVKRERGFTLVELLITVGIAMFVLAGMSALFVSQTRTAHVLNAKSEILNDLFLASQMMQLELRGAKAVCWDSAAKSIRYQPLTSPNDTPANVLANQLTALCTKNSAKNGFFQIRPKNNTDKPTPYICWDEQDDGTGCQELLRGMKAHVSATDSGMMISPTANVVDVYGKLVQTVRTITLTAEYQDRDRNIKDLSLSFKVWPRNVQ